MRQEKEKKNHEVIHIKQDMVNRQRIIKCYIIYMWRFMMITKQWTMPKLDIIHIRNTENGGSETPSEQSMKQGKTDRFIQEHFDSFDGHPDSSGTIPSNHSGAN